MLRLIVNAINMLLQKVNRSIHIQRNKPQIEPEYLAILEEQYKDATTNAKEFSVIKNYRDNRGAHGIKNTTLECEFATEMISKYRPVSILDIGSYREWLIGVMSHYQVTTLDVRSRNSRLKNEKLITGDIGGAKGLQGTHQMVTSLSSLEHFGLGRYGDDYDLMADQDAMRKIIVCLDLNGYFVFSVPVTAGAPCLEFNSHRIYNLELIHKITRGLTCVDELYIKKSPARICNYEEIAKKLGEWDIYCGCYQKQREL